MKRYEEIREGYFKRRPYSNETALFDCEKELLSVIMFNLICDKLEELEKTPVTEEKIEKVTCENCRHANIDQIFGFGYECRYYTIPIIRLKDDTCSFGQRKYSD
jgi:hypothetical protein